MFWYSLIYLILFIYAVADDKVPSPKRSEFERSLAGMNSNKKKRIICGVLSILAALPVIIDAFLKKNPAGLSQIFKVYYYDDGPMICLAISWIITFVWILWILMNLKYKENNAKKLEDKICEAEGKQAEIEERLAIEKKDNELFMSGLSAQLGAPGKIVMINDNTYKNAFIVFPVSQNIYVNSRAIPFSQLLGCEIKDETYTTVTGTKEEITRTRTGSTVGRAVVGALIAGPAGAIIGGATAKKETEVIDNTQTITHHHYFVVVNLSDIAIPILKIDCGSASPRVAEEIKGTISGIIAKKSSSQIGVGSVADELSKLANLKEQGILTEEEFAQQKRRLLSSEPHPIEISTETPLIIESGELEEFDNPLDAELARVLKESTILEAIKMYKDATGCNLAAAKDYVEDFKKRIKL